MKLLAAYLLLVLGGNESPSADDVTNLITSVGGEVDAEQLTALLGDLEGKDIHELLEKGDKDLASVVGVAVGGGAAGSFLKMGYHKLCLNARKLHFNILCQYFLTFFLL